MTVITPKHVGASWRIKSNLMSLFIMFYFTSSMLNMFRTLIHPSSRACDFSIVSSHWSCVLVSMCVGVSVWLGWGGIRVAGWSCASACYTNDIKSVSYSSIFLASYLSLSTYWPSQTLTTSDFFGFWYTFTDTQYSSANGAVLTLATPQQ